ncbi:MAG TPA: hypothetical protein ENJ93_01005 [Chloroflexi bacterium]|nr:hypothetical protein [Chloroflexota bacterium]
MILIILAILTASLTGQAFTLWFELVFETISNDFFFSTIISIGLLGLLLYFLYHGYRWAKWIAAPGLILVSLILFGLVFTTFSSPIAPIFMLVLVTQSFLYLTSGIVLSRSDDVATFLKEQERKRDKFS